MPGISTMYGLNKNDMNINVLMAGDLVPSNAKPPNRSGSGLHETLWYEIVSHLDGDVPGSIAASQSIHYCDM